MPRDTKLPCTVLHCPQATEKLLLGVLLLAVSCSEGTTTPTEQLPDVAAFVANSGSDNITVFDVGSGGLWTTNPLIQGVPNPQNIAVTPDGSKVYVTTTAPQTYAGGVSVIDVQSGQVTARISTGVSPTGIAMTPDGRKAYVPNKSTPQFDVSQYNRVSVIDVASDQPVGRILIGDGYLGGVAVTPDGRNVYVATGGRVFVIDVATESVTDSIPIGGKAPRDVTVTPDGSKVYVAGGGSDGSVSVIDAATNTVTDSIKAGADPDRIAVTPDGTRAYVTNGGSGNVSVIDVATGVVMKTIVVGPTHQAVPAGVAVTPDGTKVWVVNSGLRDISVIDVATDSIKATISARVGLDPNGIAMR